MRNDSAVRLSKSQGGVVKTNVLHGICASPGNAAVAELLGKSAVNPENRGIYTQSESPKKSSRTIWSLAVVSVDQRY